MVPSPTSPPQERTVTLNATVARMLANRVIHSRYPEFYQFLATDQPTWFVPSPLNGTSFRVNCSTAPPENHLDLTKDVRYEMLDLQYRYDNLKMFAAKQTEKLRELSDVNNKLRNAASKMVHISDQGETLDTDGLAEEIQRLQLEREGLAAVYEHEQDFVTSAFLAEIAEIPEFLAVDRMMEENQMRIQHLQSYYIRVEENFKLQMTRLRSDKVRHDNVIKQEQDLLIDRLIHRVSQMKESRRYFRESVENIYNNEYHDPSLKESLRALVSPNAHSTESYQSTHTDSTVPIDAQTSARSPTMVQEGTSTVLPAVLYVSPAPNAIILPTVSQPNRQESSRHSGHRNSNQSPADSQGRIYVRVRPARSDEFAQSNEN
ncbi:hypothetical protein B9Z55_022828 [Caenorhabditis nigoni]|nr:hypothetical protein B9Z55_022828 [Caenorhabditis nigoni]